MIQSYSVWVYQSLYLESLGGGKWTQTLKLETDLLEIPGECEVCSLGAQNSPKLVPRFRNLSVCHPAVSDFGPYPDFESDLGGVSSLRAW
eukprot:2234122-Amphidinium_carterae.1